MMSFKILLFVGFGGFFGAILRFVITQLSFKILPMGFGTLIVNVLGSFFIGLIMSYSSKFNFDENLRVLLISGFLGSLTTFSTFAYENIIFLEQNKIGMFCINSLTNFVLSIFVCYLGFLVFK